MADQKSTTGISISHHDGHLWFLSLHICNYYKYSKVANTEGVNFIRIDEETAKVTIEKLKMKVYLTSETIEFWGDREMLRVDRITKARFSKLKKEEVPNG